MNLFDKYHQEEPVVEEPEATPVTEIEVGTINQTAPLVFEDEVTEYENKAQGLERLHEIAERYQGQIRGTFGLEDALGGIDEEYVECLPEKVEVDTYIARITEYQKKCITRAIERIRERANEPLTDACLADIKTRLGEAKTYYDTMADDKLCVFKGVIAPALTVDDKLSCFDEEAWCDFNALIDFLVEFRSYRETAVDALKEGRRLGGEDDLAYIKKAVDAAPVLPGRLSEEHDHSLQKQLPAIVGAYTFQNIHLVQFQLEPNWSDVNTALKEFLYTHSVDVRTEPMSEFPTSDIEVDGATIKACIASVTEALSALTTLIAPLQGDVSSVDGTYYVPAIKFIVPALVTIEAFTTMLNEGICKLSEPALEEYFNMKWF